MRGSVFDAATVLDPADRSAGEDLGADDAVSAESSAEVTDGSVTGSAVTSTRRSWRPGPRLRTVLVSAGLVALVLLVVAGASLHRQRSANARLDDTRQQVMGVARQEAANLMSLSYNTADADLKRILSLATGPLYDQFNSQRTTIGGFLGQAKSTARADVQSAGLMSLDSDHATVLVSANATVSNNASTDAGLQNVVKHYRMAMKLQRVKGHWLVADVEFDGAAQ